MRGGSIRYPDFQAKTQWIIDNKETENIDFVLGVGDLIDAGTTFPVSIGGMSPPGECNDENPDASYTGPYETFAFYGAQISSVGGTEA